MGTQWWCHQKSGIVSINIIFGNRVTHPQLPRVFAVPSPPEGRVFGLLPFYENKKTHLVLTKTDTVVVTKPLP